MRAVPNAACLLTSLIDRHAAQSARLASVTVVLCRQARHVHYAPRVLQALRCIWMTVSPSQSPSQTISGGLTRTLTPTQASVVEPDPKPARLHRLTTPSASGTVTSSQDATGTPTASPSQGRNVLAIIHGDKLAVAVRIRFADIYRVADIDCKFHCHAQRDAVPHATCYD